jgi:pimeloyl-ACP methyl ester carboxylesterase
MVAAVTLAAVGGPAGAGAATSVAPACSTSSTPPSTPVAPGTRPVVFVHGWTSSGLAMRSTGAALTQLTGNRITPYYFDYGAHSTTWVDADAIAGCLATYLREVSATYGGKVLVVAHSMGGQAVLYAAARDNTADVLGGVVTFDTPYLGSPFGGTAAAGLLEGLRVLVGVDAPPAGSDAQVCLAPHTDGAPMPTGCDYPLPPLLPAGVPLTEIAGDITIHRDLGPFRLPDLRLGSDVIVPVSSSLGYLEQVAPADRPSGAAPVQLVDTCSITSDNLLLSASSAGWTSAQLATLATGGGALETGLDPDPTLVAYLLDAELTAPCSHGHVYKDPAGQQLAAGALLRYLDSLSTTPASTAY